MNTTTAAATQANVTVATIRTWCRRGVIAATKASGRWIVDATSLARRIAIGTMRTRKTIMTNDFTSQAAEVAQLVARFTPERGCRAADRPGGSRDRFSGRADARAAAEWAQAHIRYAIALTADEADGRNEARERLTAECGHRLYRADNRAPEFDLAAAVPDLINTLMNDARTAATRVTA
ncbi:hypothetical protein [Streptantibioticus silvisoli]|uniref:Helix-turn-helix domain-containing protein n=1 Tax=Streptantibioticus silvisoli TaxID=2705255 RepID=A0ABT6W4R0_9ACTN|nr:hypothetical protein [Streptantibioticus silvisoli]MDI5965744.1 hypothetical protein [Streptantibioticus silvisoli]